MFEVEHGVRRWRRQVERESSLSPREVDELEDHLRARVELAMELDAELSPTRALAVARKELGEAAALSPEFARAGKRNWRRWLVAGWAMFAVSLALPTFLWPSLVLGGGWSYGYEVFFLDLFTDRDFPVLLPSVGMILSVRALLNPSPGKGRWVGRILGVAGSLGVAMGVFAVVRTIGAPGPVLGIGYWMWHLSLICVAVALRIRNRDWASAEPRPVAS